MIAEIELTSTYFWYFCNYYLNTAGQLPVGSNHPALGVDEQEETLPSVLVLPLLDEQPHLPQLHVDGLDVFTQQGVLLILRLRDRNVADLQSFVVERIDIFLPQDSLAHHPLQEDPVLVLIPFLARHLSGLSNLQQLKLSSELCCYKT